MARRRFTRFRPRLDRTAQGNGHRSPAEAGSGALDVAPLPESTIEAAGEEPRPGTRTPESVAAGVFGGIRRSLRDAMRWGDLRRTPFGLRPALLLGLVAMVVNFNAVIFWLVLPEMAQSLDLKLGSIIAIVQVLAFLLIFFQVLMGYLLDRMPRVRFYVGGTIVSGIFSILTGRASSALTIGSTRALDSVVGTAADVPTFSLASDYYPVSERGKMFAFVGTLGRVGTRVAPLGIALIVAATSWRTPYFITGPLLFVLGIISLALLREPVRGYFERKALGLPEEEARTPEPPVSFGEAWRTIWGIRTLRRLFVGGMVGGIGDQVIGILYSVFLFQAYGMTVLPRGRLLFVAGMFALAGGFIGGGIIDVLMKRRPQRVLIFSGFLGVLAGIFFSIQAAKPPVFVLYVLMALMGFSGALLGPARGVFYSQVLPAHMRTVGFSVFALAGIPATIGFALLASRVPTWGYQGVIAAAGPFIVIGSLIDMSAAGLFERDMRNALASQMATAMYRKAREQGTVKLLLCKSVEVEYDGVQVLFGVDFEANEGEIIALLGANGAGKSTLLKAIAGVSEASGGAVLLDGRDITHVPPHEIASRGIVLMPGGRGVFPGLTVRDNLRLGTWGQDEEAARGRLEEVLEMFPSLRARAGHRASTLSGGEQQMVALAMAFLARPRLLLIDELSLGLAPAVVQDLLVAVRRMRDAGITIVLVEQSVNLALTVAERAVFMEKGEVRFVGPTADLLRRPDILRAVYVRGAAAVGAARESRAAAEDLAGREVALRVEDVSIAFGGVRALDHVSLDLYKGEILGVIGPNGAGKTTLFDVISGFAEPQHGHVYLEGRDLLGLPAHRRARLQVVRRFQDARLYSSLTVRETLLVALDRQHRARSMVLTAISAPPVRLSERKLGRRADELIDLLGLGNARDKFVRELSTGMRRIVDLACAIAAEPKVLLLDEPSSGIAQAEAESLGPLLRRVRAEAGCSMMLIEHDMPLIARASDELMAMHQGAILVRGAPEEVLANPLVVESYLGTSEDVIKRSGVVR